MEPTEGMDYSDAVIAAKDAEIAKLKTQVIGGEKGIIALGHSLDERRAEIARLTAALKAERDACDEAEDHLRQCFVHHMKDDANEDAVRAWRDARSARRAADARRSDR